MSHQHVSSVPNLCIWKGGLSGGNDEEEQALVFGERRGKIILFYGRKTLEKLGLKAKTSESFPTVSTCSQQDVQGVLWLKTKWKGDSSLCHGSCIPPKPPTLLFTFVQDRPKDCQAVINGGAVPAAASELVLALLDAQLHPLCHAGHDFYVVPAEAELLWDEARDGAAEDGLGPQGAVLLA